MYYVYILQSLKTGRYYIGQTHSIGDRLMRHNRGLVHSTKHGVPWKMMFSEAYETRGEAVQREKEIKSYKSGFLFQKLLRS